MNCFMVNLDMRKDYRGGGLWCRNQAHKGRRSLRLGWQYEVGTCFGGTGVSSYSERGKAQGMIFD
jgi:hypothetical protein